MIKRGRENFYRYLVDQQGKDWGITLTTCGYQHISPGEAYPPGGHPDSHAFSWKKGRKLGAWHLVYIPTGSGIFETEHQAYHLKSGDLMLIAKEEWHRYKPLPKSGWEEYWVGFKGDYFQKYLRNELFPSSRSHVRTIGYSEEILFAFNQLIELSKKGSPIYRKVMMGFVIQLVAYFSAAEKQHLDEDRNSFVVENTIESIRQNLAGTVDFHILARDFHLSYISFRRIFKNETGLPPQQFLIRERIESAKRLLANTRLPVKQIAYKTGFQSLPYFSRLYRSTTGQNPSARGD